MPKSSIHKPCFNNVMIDLETMGNLPGCVIVSIGAVEFDLLTGETGREFYRVIDMQSCLNVGLFVQASTIEWWLNQSEAARKEITFKSRVKIEVALIELEDWFRQNPGSNVWGNGIGFDISILKMAYDAIKVTHPWEYNAERDVRTIVDLDHKLKNSTEFIGTRHEPIADCKHQIQYMTAIYKSKIKKK